MADENVPSEAVESARALGHDVAWMSELAPGTPDEEVLVRAYSDGRVLITCDKGFGALALRAGSRQSCGVILLRPRLRSPDHVAQFLASVLSQEVSWEGNFAVAQEGRLRVLRLPE